MALAVELNRMKHEAFQALLPGMTARIDWPRERIEKFRESALKSFIARLKTQSPWHAKRLAQVDPGHFSEKDLQAIPPMTKSDLLENFDEIATDRRLNLGRCKEYLQPGIGEKGYIDDRYQVSTSGGTGGTPALVVFSWEEAARQWAVYVRFLYRWRDRTGKLPLNPVVASITTPHPIFRTQHLVKFFETAEANVFPVTGPIEEITAGLNRARPDILMLYPSIIPRLVLETEAGRLRIAPVLVIAAAEPMLSEHEAAISRPWNCTVIDGWGATEVGVMAMGSGFDAGMLLMDDEVIVEPVDRNGNPVVPGKLAEKVYVTPLFRFTLPLVRYELTDRVELSDARPNCGSGFRMISGIEGRLEDLFKYEGGIEISPGVFKKALAQEPGILEYQVHQTRQGAHIILTSATPIDGERLSRSICSLLGEFMDNEPVVTVRQVDLIERSGDAAKLRRFISLEKNIARCT